MHMIEKGATLLVWVRSSSDEGATCITDVKWRMRAASARVLPDPGPAMTSIELLIPWPKNKNTIVILGVNTIA
jgi:hypothetical protein